MRTKIMINVMIQDHSSVLATPIYPTLSILFSLRATITHFPILLYNILVTTSMIILLYTRWSHRDRGKGNRRSHGSP